MGQHTYHHLLFDADGTLFDFNSAERRSLEEMAAQLGIAWNLQVFNTYHGINTSVWQRFEQNQLSMEQLKVERFRLFLEAIGCDADPLVASQTYIACLAKQGILIEGAVDLVRNLASEGYDLVLITNGISEVQRGRLDASGLGNLFNHVVISEEVGCQKPSMEYFHAMSRLTGIGPGQYKQALIIGDSLSADIRGGNQAGIDTCWYNPDLRTAPPDLIPTYQIAALAQLPSILG